MKEFIKEARDKDVFELLFMRELYRGTATPDQAAAQITPCGDGFVVKFIKPDEITDEFPNMGNWSPEE